MYDYNYGSSYGEMADPTGILGGLMAVGGIIMLISSIVGIIMIISQWKIFKKAGKKGWESIVPIYNFVVLLQIVELPIWYIVLLFVPIANIYAMFKIYIGLAHKFGKSTGFGVATVFFSFVCLPILAFGKNIEYKGESNSNTQPNNQYNPSVAPQNNLNNINNNAQDSNAPFTFNQNIDTQINPMPTPVQEEPMVSPTPAVNPQPEINSVPSMEIQPESNQPTSFVYNAQPEINNVPVMEAQQENNQPTPFVYNVQPTTEVAQIPQPIITPTAPVEPVINTNPVQQPVVDSQPINPEPQLNVIPGMGPIPQPILTPENPGNSSNNTTM